jgi:hypothetical protein
MFRVFLELLETVFAAINVWRVKFEVQVESCFGLLVNYPLFLSGFN